MVEMTQRLSFRLERKRNRGISYSIKPLHYSRDNKQISPQGRDDRTPVIPIITEIKIHFNRK